MPDEADIQAPDDIHFPAEQARRTTRAGDGNAADPVIGANIQYRGGSLGCENTEKEEEQQVRAGRKESKNAIHNEAIIKQTPSPVK